MNWEKSLKLLIDLYRAGDGNFESIESYISNLLQAQKAELFESLPKEKEELTNEAIDKAIRKARQNTLGGEVYSMGFDMGFNEAIRQIKSNWGIKE